MFVKLNVGDDDEDTFVFARADPPVALGASRVLAREVWRLQDAHSVLGVKGTLGPLAVGGSRRTLGVSRRVVRARPTARLAPLGLQAQLKYSRRHYQWQHSRLFGRCCPGFSPDKNPAGRAHKCSHHISSSCLTHTGLKKQQKACLKRLPQIVSQNFTHL